VNAPRGGLRGGDPRRSLDGGQVPTRRFAERHGKHRAVAVNYIMTEQQRDVQPAVFHRELLRLARGLGADDVENRAHLAAFDLLIEIEVFAARRRRTDKVERAAVLVELADLFVERHAPEEIVDLLLGCRYDQRGAGERARQQDKQ